MLKKEVEPTHPSRKLWGRDSQLVILEHKRMAARSVYQIAWATKTIEDSKENTRCVYRFLTISVRSFPSPTDSDITSVSSWSNMWIVRLSHAFKSGIEIS